jgi:hypothetical protein
MMAVVPSTEGGLASEDLWDCAGDPSRTSLHVQVMEVGTYLKNQGAHQIQDRPLWLLHHRSAHGEMECVSSLY